MRNALALLCAVVAAGAVVGCNVILGIDRASAEPADAGASPDGPEPLTCGQYCDVIMQNCTGPNQEYLSRDICISMCPVFELGTNTDSRQDTLGCRLWHAHAAANAPQIHCAHSGPLGGQHCGDACEAFCNLDTANCSGANSAYDGGFPTCVGACPVLSYAVGADAGDLTAQNGNTLNCRLWHLESAYASPAAGMFHCPHTGVDSSMCR